MDHFQSQIYRSYCGVASSVTALNALGYISLTQEAYFEPEQVNAVAPMEQVLFGGMTLDTLGALLNAHGADANVLHAEDVTIEEFRSSAIGNLQREGDFVLINYLRSTMGQETGGHISPIAAWDVETDRVLVLDVADYKYPPVWVDAALLFEAMNAVDSESGLSRGAVFVEFPTSDAYGIPPEDTHPDP